MTGTIFQEIEAIYDASVSQAAQVITDHQQQLARQTVAQALSYLAPAPDISTAGWADEYRYLAPGTTAKPGKWRTSERPYLRGIMDAFDDPVIETITVEKASRMGITECINNLFGRHIHHDPCAMMYGQQTLGEVKKYNAKIFKKFVAVTPVLRAILPEEKSRQSGNTQFEKSFPGGSLTLVGGNVATGFRMVYQQIVVGDDLDGWEWVVGKEGDPVENMIGRTEGIWNRKIILVSKPTIKQFSRIDLSYEQSDKKLYHVPCPHCDHGQPLRFAAGKDLPYGIKWDGDDPYSAYYLCEQCGGIIRDYHKRAMLEHGDWIATAVPKDSRHAGFGGLSQIYHPDIPFSQLARHYIKCHGNPELLQVFYNDHLGECWEDKGEGLSETGLYARREEYGCEVPEGVAMLTASVDVGDNHLACGIEGWGRAMENWKIDYTVFEGDTLLPDIWNELDKHLLKAWKFYDGISRRPLITMIDSGYRDEMVSSFVRARAKTGRNIIAIKGVDRTKTGEIVSGITPSKKNKYKVNIYIVNDDKAKLSILGRLKIPKPGGGYVHFPAAEWCNEEYFDQLLSEKKVRVRDGRGGWENKWIRKPGVRNEPFDCAKYNLAALIWMQKHRKFDLDKTADLMCQRVEAEKLRRMETGELPANEYFMQRAKAVQERVKEQEQKKSNPMGMRVLSKGIRRN